MSASILYDSKIQKNDRRKSDNSFRHAVVRILKPFSYFELFHNSCSLIFPVGVSSGVVNRQLYIRDKSLTPWKTTAGFLPPSSRTTGVKCTDAA